MTGHSSAVRVERDFHLIEAAAAVGDRCPHNWPHGPLSSASIGELVEAKRIRSEVYSRNWRVVVIMDGPHRGKSTAAPPWGGSPYLVNGVHVDRLARRAGNIAP